MAIDGHVVGFQLTSSHLMYPVCRVCLRHKTTQNDTHVLRQVLHLLTMLTTVKCVNFIITATLYHLGEILRLTL